MTEKTIVFVHGLFTTYHCWDSWVGRYQSRGYSCLALSYPGRDKPVEELRRRHPDPEVGRLTFDSVLEHIEQAVRTLPEPPILYGHSMGGLIVQGLLNRGLGAAGVTLSSAPPKGLFSARPTFFISSRAFLNPLLRTSTPYLTPFSTFRHTFLNGLPDEAQRAVYDAQVPPEALGIARGVLTSKKAEIDYSKPHAPLLMIGGGRDNIIPASLAKANADRYKKSASLVEYKEYPANTHWVFGDAAWEEVADYSLAWVESKLNG